MKIKLFKEKYTNKVKKNVQKKKSDYNWIIKITLLAFLLSCLFSYLSEVIISNLNLYISIIITILFILLGIIFDMVGISVAVSDIKTFNSMASKKIKGAKIAIKFIKNADKSSSFCNDVIGDICGIISGSTGIIIATELSKKMNLELSLVIMLTTAIIASLTIGGKALGKSIAINNSARILYYFSKTVSIFIKK